MEITERDVSVVVPTYCEAENLPVLVPQITATLKQHRLRGEILIIDDNSPDDTVTICHQLAQDNPLRLIIRMDERGLASAVVRGLQEARGNVLLVMDADLSHPPRAIPALVSACQSEAVDFVIGSRYVPGGSVDSSWGCFRRLNSSVASWLARGLTSAKDPLAGFFALKKSTFQRAREIRPLGYKIGLELIVRCQCQGIFEVPIRFQDRALGQSKLSLQQQWLYLRHLGRLYLTKYASPFQGRHQAGESAAITTEPPLKKAA